MSERKGLRCLPGQDSSQAKGNFRSTLYNLGQWAVISGGEWMWTQDTVSLEVSSHQPACFHTLSKLPRDSESAHGGTGGFWNTGARPSWAQGGSSGNAAVMLLWGTRDEDHRSVPKDAKKQWEIQEQRNGCGSIILPHWCGQQETQAADLIGYFKK